MSKVEQNNVSLSPPWYMLRNQIAYTVGKTPGVKVDDLMEGENPGEYILKIHVNTCINQAEAMRLILPEAYMIGNIKVITEIYLDGRIVTMPNLAITTPDQVAKILSNALWCNPLAVGTVLTDDSLPPIQQEQVGSVVLLIQPCVIMFYDDDISNLCSNYIEVASKVFFEVINLSYGSQPIKISVTTYDKKCIPCDKITKVCC